MRRLVWLASFVLVLSAVPLGVGAASPAAPVTAAPQCGSEPGQQAQAPRDAATTRVPPVSCLANSGAGAVKGFAWTLSIGVLTTVFSAVLVTQVLLAWWFRAARPKTLPIGH